jgi:hypothetical protein
LLGRALEPFGGADRVAFDTAAIHVEGAYVELRQGVALIGGERKPTRGLGEPLRDTLATCVERANRELRVRDPGLGGDAIPVHRLEFIGGGALAGIVHLRQRHHRLREAAACGAAETAFGGDQVLRNAVTAPMQQPEIEAGARVAALRPLFKQRRRLTRIPRDAGTTQIHEPERELGAVVILFRRPVVMPGRGGVIGLDAEPVGVKHAKPEITLHMTGLRGQLVPEARLFVVDLAGTTARVKERRVGLRRRQALLGGGKGPAQRFRIVGLDRQPVG